MVAPDQWAELDRVGRAGDFKRAIEMQELLRPLSDLIFDEPIVEAVARIKIVLKNERLIAHENSFGPPQMGIGEAEKAELLKRYAHLRATTDRTRMAGASASSEKWSALSGFGSALLAHGSVGASR